MYQTDNASSWDTYQRWLKHAAFSHAKRRLLVWKNLTYDEREHTVLNYQGLMLQSEMTSFFNRVIRQQKWSPVR